MTISAENQMEKAEDALKATVGRAVSQGFFGLASGKDPANFDRVWFKEAMEPADITFDYDTHLLTAAKAKALKQGVAQPAAQPVQQPTPPLTEPPLIPGTPPGAQPGPPAPKPAVVTWEGPLKREQWNLFSLKVLTRLAQSDDLQIDVKVKATLKEGQTTEQLNSALTELGISDPFRKQ
jgi:hypothetical protein